MATWNWAHTQPRWSFVVDTDSYAGNFERELSSYVVGQCDEYGEHRGAVYLAMYEEDFDGKDPFEDLVESRVDDHGDDQINRAPMALAPTPGYENDGAGNHRAIATGKTPKHPAFNSVAIFLSRKPTDGELKILIQRAKAFAKLPKVKDWDYRPEILSCRLVEERAEIVSHAIEDQ